MFKPVAVVIGLSIPFSTDLSNNKKYETDQTMNVYISPTLNQPYDTYTEKVTRELVEQIFIDQVKDAK